MLGSPRPDDDVRLVSIGDDRPPLALYARDGRLTGVLGFNAARHVMGLRRAVREGLAVPDVLVDLAA
jgi:hypothetical protein